MSLIPVACAGDPPLFPSQSNQKVSLQGHRDINTYNFFLLIYKIYSREEINRDETALTRPRLPPISKLLAISSNELAAVLATTSPVIAARFRLIEVTIHMPLEGGLQMNTDNFLIFFQTQASDMRGKHSHYLRAESETATVHDAPKGFITAMRQNMSLQPSSGT